MNKIKSILITIIGTMVLSFGLGVFLMPNKIVGGGVSGISTILYHSVKIAPGISIFVINILFLIIGLKVLGKNFTIKTIFGVALVSVFTQAFSYMPFYTNNTILASIFGGVLYGLGIGLSFAAEASTGGTDILGRLFQHKFPTMPIGKLLLMIDGVIILISLVIFKNIELTLFGIITLFVSSFSVDWVINTLNISCLAFVITEKGSEISNKLISTSPRGVTVIDAVGAYTKDQKQMLFCALKESESDTFQKKILETDPKSFIVFAQSQRIKGNGFYLYK